ncbi:carbohydrate-binding module family 24 protein [Xylona heveae TC161]|uniref:Carbohydrate-binding module family 24 protein n=1 Tax=Xylona heveae (strain CBS 132557 / TC161) TaxID=1328760 RepID=A0A165GM28_XYLHT|nr:carbohydrate-binding module family 24 protein [Xylona heveae TC161]KZF22359.1 carbohydrate-binding module family 24 protein [Xylona heveae TC161]
MARSGFVYSPVQAKAVFAHFMVGNAANFSLSDWETDIRLARDAHIDAFALNIGNGTFANTTSLSHAFSAANNLGAAFKLFFSFDYAGNGDWDKEDVIDLLNEYGTDAAYYKVGSQPFVSTFEGPHCAEDWIEIKKETNCYFVPSWSSLGAKAAVEAGPVDGLFSWGAWPEGPNNMNTQVDASYLYFLEKKAYMMPVSPWFFTNMPSYHKNWLWRGDDLWHDRWQQVQFFQPDFVEIISWNDFGESHYIGPTHSSEYTTFALGKSPYNYADSMPHDGWRLFLPYLIDTYKNGIASITEEGLVTWHRLQPASSCTTGNTTGNAASELQSKYAPSEIVQDRIFYSALLASDATVTVTIGGVVQSGSWEHVPADGVGIYHGSVPFNDNLGDVVVRVWRNSEIVVEVRGATLNTACTDDIENWNAFVSADSSGKTMDDPVQPSLPISQQVCVDGFGLDDDAGLCSFACSFGCCPVGTCTCTALGPQPAYPQEPPQHHVCPGSSTGNNFGGTLLDLCDFTCNLGHCPDACPNSTTTSSSGAPAQGIPTQINSSPAETGTSNDRQKNLATRCTYTSMLWILPLVTYLYSYWL